jgi:hypothetical protein
MAEWHSRQDRHVNRGMSVLTAGTATITASEGIGMAMQL